ncbi:hypothetical protein A6X21_12935 [Planctopirus hydrillae]|uniref:Uncharacterized protein n=1 Tax=Planctopirus hydrillae TaxID=1841610 RepID=A0A1C3E613_9PLAN|nr:hypothetical protein A6X21_12935 [Planctopirus hydrillae]
MLVSQAHILREVETLAEGGSSSKEQRIPLADKNLKFHVEFYPSCGRTSTGGYSPKRPSTIFHVNSTGIILCSDGPKFLRSGKQGCHKFHLPADFCHQN